jgi:hypothetical protein
MWVQKRIIHFMGLCLLSLFFLVLQAHGVMMGLSTEALTEMSDLIITGKVENVETQWSEDGKKIISRAEVIMNEVIKGEIVGVVVLVEYDGGEIGNVGMRVSDVRSLKSGEEVLLFLKSKEKEEKVKEGSYHIVGRAQGHYTIDRQGFARKSGFSIIDKGDLIDNNVPLDVLIEKIRKVGK